MNSFSKCLDPAAEEQASLWAARLDGSVLSAGDQNGVADVHFRCGVADRFPRLLPAQTRVRVVTIVCDKVSYRRGILREPQVEHRVENRDRADRGAAGLAEKTTAGEWIGAHVSGGR